ncbi:hypothetical protein [Pseudarthrobacter sulfonivorans]|uniref:hypothetical protein n=1 Tax=Pseudarthrobacter sulfonivorans TaxID=121292 RepID=UPI0028666548|nr:hypothetical protein [Pseudarthrobacter sulfonivorans]MDR6414002.1 hypothetical protein [Pseudarthrobacter sulfonivorans]
MKRILAALGVTGLALLGATAPAAANDNAKSDHKITICHATGSATNPYVSVTIDVHALKAHVGHQHEGDIIPANDGKVLKGGQNLDKVHLIASGCRVPDKPGNGDDDDDDDDDNGNGHGNRKITICHATGSDRNPYVQITVDLHAVKGHAHHQNGDDIIPPNDKLEDGNNWTGEGRETYHNDCEPVDEHSVKPPVEKPEKPGKKPVGAVVEKPAGAGAVVVNNPGFNVQTAVAASDTALAPWAGGLIVMLLAAAAVAARKVLPEAGVSRHRKD